MNVTNARDCLYMFKTNYQIEKISLKNNSIGEMNQCNQKHEHELCLHKKQL